MADFAVAAAQLTSRRGQLEQNVAEHLRFIRAAAAAGVRLLVFPELSLTGYELDLARSMQMELSDHRLGPLRAASADFGMHLVVGAPWRSHQDRPYLGAFIIAPGEIEGYAKIHVHESERPYFAAGSRSCMMTIGEVRVGFGICADASHPRHAEEVADRAAEVYVVSVMKTPGDYPAHARRLGGYAERLGMAVLTANYAGGTGGMEAAGRSAFWDDRGEQLACVGHNRPVVLIARRTDEGWGSTDLIEP